MITRRLLLVLTLLGVGVFMFAQACVDPATDHVQGKESLFVFLDEGDLETADQLLLDCWQLPRYDEACFDGMPQWDEDPFDENYWRFIFYSLRHTRHLTWAYQTTGDPAYRDKLIEILWSFLEAESPHDDTWKKYTAAFRGAVLVNNYWKLAHRGDLDQDLARELEAAINETGVFLADPDHFDADYNHGFAEAATLLLIAENCPSTSTACSSALSDDWAAVALERIDLLMELAVDEDGVEVEQSPTYHFYVLNFVWEIYHWSQRYDVHLGSSVTDAMDPMVRYATLITLPNGDFPMIGSSLADNVQTYGLSPTTLEQIADSYPEFRYIRTLGEEGTEPSEKAVLFPSSGQFIYRSAFGPAQDFAQPTHVVFDVGSFRTAHSHLDALSLHLYSAGRTLLTDSGLFTYEEGDYNDYFWGTSAHNTVVVDGLDQDEGTATPGSTIHNPDWTYQSGFHELYEGVVHGRAMLSLDPYTLLVIDELTSEDVHHYHQIWHLFEGADPQGTAQDLMVYEDGAAVLRILQSDLATMSLDVRFGEEDPIQGWLSEEYEILFPGQTLEYGLETDHAVMVTLLNFGPRTEIEAQVSHTQVDQTVHIDVELEDGCRTIQIEALGRNSEVVDVGELTACAG